ncbi:hypothetical protein NDU88_006198 [Pleurodeles waltl]|uniref:Uncharacterized protein n=1 Tax=Pleurodeles waltl TaxID=8319 RepID=A0AAV7TWG0_PLEWA|nr:hypothetical protein NDU88_006198 [Pleurodeles waltl]
MKEDGRLSPELRATVAPRRRRGPCGGLDTRRNPPTTSSFRPNLNNRPPRPYRPAARLGGKGGKMAYTEGGAVSHRPENRLS